MSDHSYNRTRTKKQQTPTYTCQTISEGGKKKNTSVKHEQKKKRLEFRKKKKTSKTCLKIDI